MPRVFVSDVRRPLAGAALLVGLAMLLGMSALAPASRAAADPTVWLCKPGDTPNSCAGSLDGRLETPGGPSPGPLLGYRVAQDPKVDCFYVYPTQSEQTTPNADFSKDPELLRPTINQVAQFSRTCRVYAPVYRQYTQWALSHPEVITPEVRDLAYNDVKNAWDNYLSRYNKGRGVIVIGHSQGTSHMARLMAAEVDGNPKVRSRIIGAYLIGGNVYVPKGKLVGGQFKHMPACTSGTETGCIVAYSSFREEPVADSMFGRAGVGYWINPNPAPDPATEEIMCVNPASFNGDAGKLRVMVNIGAFLTPSPNQIGTPWSEYDGFYTADCKNENGASWLEVDPVTGTSSPTLTGLLEQAASSNGSDPHGNLHVADVNLGLDNLVTLAGTQSEAWLAKDAERSRLAGRQAKLKRTLKRLTGQAARAGKRCRKARPGSAARRTDCRKAKQLKGKVKRTKRQIAAVGRQIGRLG